MNYLSDEELENLINDIEKNELVTVPPDMSETVMKKLHDGKAKQDKKTEFRCYCFEIVVAMAASFLILFSLSALQKADVRMPEISTQKTYQTKEEYNADHKLPDREETIKKNSSSLFDMISDSINENGGN